MNNSSSPLDKSELPQLPESMWRQSIDLPSFSKLNKDIDTEVAVIGAGITGITTAYLLVKAGIKVCILETGTILDGTTGYTTAKITSQHGLIYDNLIKYFGQEGARLYFEANEKARSFISQTIHEHNISCQFQQQPAYLYADSDEQLEKLRNEWSAYEQLELPGEWVDDLPVPGLAKGAILMPDQAQFHPLQYLKTLLEYITQHGGKVYEDTTIEDKVEDIEDNKLHLQTSNGHSITCRYAVSASHFPFSDGGGLYFTRLHADRSYVVAIEPKTPLSKGIYINCGDPKRSLRSAEYNGKQLILVGGESHQTGKSDCTITRYEELEQFGQQLFGIKSIPFRWSAQDLATIDGIPYIGSITSRHPYVYVATGYGKWGMTSGTLAALIISDLIQGQKNRYAELFTPSRFKANPGIKNLAVQNAEVAAEWITGKIEKIYLKAEDLVPGQGAVVSHRGKRAGAYRDDKGIVHLVDTTCTHLGCELEWNSAERSWDCPCHGSRFNYRGAVIEGPATKNLTPLKLQYKDSE
ncbi:Gamma-glutamylputrescine oxidoreductase [compost metagenome]